MSDQLHAALLGRLERLPAKVQDQRRFYLGEIQGLKFSIVQFPHGSRDVFVEGATTQMEPLSNEHQGPIAVLNAANRLINSFDDLQQQTTAAIELAKQQVHDYEQRVGIPFEFDEYVKELSELRNSLKLALADRPSEP